MQQEKSCNCRNSKCMKLYCQCFAARLTCSPKCHCIDCHNTPKVTDNPNYVQAIAERDKKVPYQDLIRTHRGCACRKSYCMKKYCECFQAGIVCKETCKCIDCHNNESVTNARIVTQLKKNKLENPHNQNKINLYPLYLSQKSGHLSQSKEFQIEANWLKNCVTELYQGAKNGSVETIMTKLIQLLDNEQRNLQEYDKNENRRVQMQAGENPHQSQDCDENISRQGIEISDENKDQGKGIFVPQILLKNQQAICNNNQIDKESSNQQ